MELNETQQKIFDLYKQGNNVFLTGPGGCGKSFLIKHIYQDAIQQNKTIYVTALTGCAAILLKCNATTLHSWASIKNINIPSHKLVRYINNNPKLKNKWINTDILIIDEVSMLSKKLFELLDELGKLLRDNITKPFGGIQLIFSGDFFQLPPIGNKIDYDSSKFCFESERWSDTFDHQINLKHIFRQSDDTYLQILNEIRIGNISQNSIDILNNKVKEYKLLNQNKDINTIPIRLMCNKLTVSNINNTEINNLTTKLYKYKYKPVYITVNTNKYTKSDIKKEEQFIIKNSIIPEILYLKLNSQVMCIVNKPEQNICNGSMGKIIGFTPSGHPQVLFDNNKKLTIKPFKFESTNVKGFYILQYPLILAWAITIHKSQGQTLEKAEMDLGSSVFSNGQSYVALSRVKSLDGLYLKSFDPNRIGASKKVIQYYSQF
jgi:ATP-dependent DNA helicase PIF1